MFLKYEHLESQKGTDMPLMLPWILCLTEMPWIRLEECAHSNGVQNILTDDYTKDGSLGPSSSFFLFFFSSLFLFFWMVGFACFTKWK